MSTTNDDLGGRIALVKPADLSSSQQSLYKTINETSVPWANASGFIASIADGRLVGPFNILLESPGLGEAFLQFQSAEQKTTSLSERVRQVVILTVGSVWKAPYELYAHSAVARTAGLPEITIQSLVKGEVAKDLTAEETTAQDFTKQLATERTVSQQSFDKAKAAFGVRGIVDIVFLAGCYETVCSLLNTFAVPVPTFTDEQRYREARCCHALQRPFPPGQAVLRRFPSLVEGSRSIQSHQETGMSTSIAANLT